MCYGDPSATEVPPCCETATKKLTFSTTSVLLLLNMPLSLSRATIFRRQKNPRRVYRPKIAGILFVCNEPEGKYYTVPYCCVSLDIVHPACDAHPPVGGVWSRSGRAASAHVRPLLLCIVGHRTPRLRRTPACRWRVVAQRARTSDLGIIAVYRWTSYTPPATHTRL